MKEFIGINLNYIKRVLVTPDETGYEQGLDHHFLDLNGPLDVYDNTLPMAVLNISLDPKNPTVAYIQERFRDNIETVKQPPNGYELIIVSWILDDNSDYDKSHVM